jgi:hypothetical protein
MWRDDEGVGSGRMILRSISGLLVLAMLLLSGCGLIRPSEELRYRLTVEVETPQGLKTGSSVIEVRGVKNPDWVTPEGLGTRSSYRGEAVAVDLPGGKTLFALLNTTGDTDAAEFPWLAFRDRLTGSDDWLESMRMMREWKGEVAPMPATEPPQLVTFGDIRNPKSVERVDAAALDKSFGPGVKLRRVTVEITDDARTAIIDKRLVWRKQVGQNQLNGDRFEGVNPELSAHVSAYSFSTERPQ